MLYSFVKPRKKYMVHQDTKVWLVFAFLMVGLMFSLEMMLDIQKSKLKELVTYNKNVIKKSNLKINDKKEDLSILRKQLNVVEILYENNLAKKDSIKNLFSLIPNGIRLTYVYASKEKLIIKGFTSTKDIYNYRLAIHLRSIFYKTNVNFVKIRDNLYSFRTINSYESSPIVKSSDFYSGSDK